MFQSSGSVVLDGSQRAISQDELRQLQISLCQHAPAVTNGLNEIQPLQVRYYIADTDFRFGNPDELLCYGEPLPSYRQMIAHFGLINQKLAIGDCALELFQEDRDIIVAVRLKTTTEWLHAAVTDGFVSFTCLGPCTRVFQPGMALLLAA